MRISYDGSHQEKTKSSESVPTPAGHTNPFKSTAVWWLQGLSLCESGPCIKMAEVMIKVMSTKTVNNIRSTTSANCCHSNLTDSRMSCSRWRDSLFSIVWQTLERTLVKLCSSVLVVSLFGAAKIGWLFWCCSGRWFLRTLFSGFISYAWFMACLSRLQQQDLTPSY